MKVRSLFVVHSMIAFVFGLSFLLAPIQVISIYGGVLTEAGALVGRLFGGTLLTIAAVLWLAREADESTARQAILQGVFVTLIVGVLAALHGVLTGAVNAFGWSTVIIYLALALCYGSLIFRK